jgi:thiazole/oxazole-forming peptide maturase SagD family component
MSRRLESALIKGMAETLERYAHFAFPRAFSSRWHFGSQAELASRLKLLSAEDLRGLQVVVKGVERSGRALTPFSPETPLCWVDLREPLSGQTVHVPAQAVFVGYRLRVDGGEPWHFVSVTSGTATHVTHEDAALNALLELIQIDAVTGHWYTGRSAPRIAFESDAKSQAVLAAVARLLGGRCDFDARFYWLEQAHVPIPVVACRLTNKRAGGYPREVFGIGTGLSPQQAVYSALVEAAGVVQLARLALMDGPSHAGKHEAKGPILDLDSNVVHYARGNGSEILRRKFNEGASVVLSDLPSLSAPRPAAAVARLLTLLREKGLRVLSCNATTEDARRLGLHTLRFWSPDLLPLPLPSAPAWMHKGFAAYGGWLHDDPHPYP